MKKRILTFKSEFAEKCLPFRPASLIIGPTATGWLVVHGAQVVIEARRGAPLVPVIASHPREEIPAVRLLRGARPVFLFSALRGVRLGETLGHSDVGSIVGGRTAWLRL